MPLNFLSRCWGSINNDVVIPKIMRSCLYNFYSFIFKCNLMEVVDDLNSFPNLGAFFTRKIDLKYRPMEKATMISPVDGNVVSFGKLQDKILVKGVEYNVSDLLGYETSLNKHYVVLYLAPGDYHRCHAPVDFETSTVVHVPGKLLPVSPKMFGRIPNLYNLNERVVLQGEWKHGSFDFVFVGALNVGSIIVENEKITKTKNKLYSFKKMDQVGMFQLGSTVVCVFEANNVEWKIKPNQKIKLGQVLMC